MKNKYVVECVYNTLHEGERIAVKTSLIIVDDEKEAYQTLNSLVDDREREYIHKTIRKIDSICIHTHNKDICKNH